MTTPFRHSRAARRRRGLLTFELILVLPLLLIVVLATIELATMLLANQALSAAAHVGAREASIPGATRARVERAVEQALSPWRFAPALDPVHIDPPNLSAARTGAPVTVRLSVRSSAAVPDLLRFVGLSLEGQRLEAAYVLRKE